MDTIVVALCLGIPLTVTSCCDVCFRPRISTSTWDGRDLIDAIVEDGAPESLLKVLGRPGTPNVLHKKTIFIDDPRTSSHRTCSLEDLISYSFDDPLYTSRFENHIRREVRL